MLAQIFLFRHSVIKVTFGHNLNVKKKNLIFSLMPHKIAVQQRSIKPSKEPQPERTGCKVNAIPVITLGHVQKYQEGSSVQSRLVNECHCH